jgi:NitT/TauT family transport system ATP-binding protein
VPAYAELDFSVRAGEFFCILGPSGCGKSTLLRTIAGLEQPSSGALTCHTLANQQRPSIGMVFQEQGLFPWMTVQDNVLFLLQNNAALRGQDLQLRTAQALAQVGLERFASLYPHQLSGGMRQRVAIARSFANEPDILLMDEPFVFLDFQTRLGLQALLLSLWQQTHRTVVFVTHDIDEAILLADRIMVMSAHPGTVKQVIPVDLPRPRDVLALRQSPQFTQYVGQATELLREELLPELQIQSTFAETGN